MESKTRTGNQKMGNGLDTTRARYREDSRNYRKHSKKNLDLISRSLAENGAGRSILLDNTGESIAGSGTLNRAQKLGVPIREIHTDGSELIAVIRDDIGPDDPRRKRLALADNACSDSSDWDFEALAADWAPEELVGWDIDIPEEYLKHDNNNDPEDIPEIPEEIQPASIRGEVYQLGKHRLMCGDSTSHDDIAKLMQDEKADLVFTDPPYDLTELCYLDFALEYCKHNVFIMNSEQRIVDLAARQRKAFRRLFSNHFKVAGILSNNNPITMVDYIAEFREENHRGNFQNLKDCFTTFLEVVKVHGGKTQDSFGHKQAKRVELPETFILHYSKVGEIVLDLFLGAGSTLIACEKKWAHLPRDRI